ncbi:MAG: 3'-5' exonuclease [Sandaracinaceae bacterium]
MDLLAHFGPWRDLPFVVLDFETTGTDPDEDRAVEIAAARFEEGTLVGSIGMRLNPGRPIPEGASAVHGIRDADVADCHPLESLLVASERLEADWAACRLRELVTGAVPVAYCERFDRPMLRAAEKRAGARLVPEAWSTWIDPLTIVKVIEGDRVRFGKGAHKLGAVCERWGVTLDNAHAAEADAIATGRLLAKIGEKSVGRLTVSELIRRQREHAAKLEAGFQRWLARKKAKEAAAATAPTSAPTSAGAGA